MTFDQLSVEEWISGTFWNHHIQEQRVLNFRTLHEPRSTTAKTKLSPCDLSDYIDPRENIDKNALDMYVSFGNAQGHSMGSTNQDESGSAISYTSEQSIHTSTQEVSGRSTIPVVPSAGLTMTKKLEISSNQITIVSDLELNYRPRYKTDYFPPNGKIRSPRYVTGREGNHHVLLNVMSKERGLIRIDWVTIGTVNNIRYSMPYKFQTDHRSPEALDHNPIYTPVNAGGCALFQHHLVLIKSKQDELKNISSLSVFPPPQPALKKTPMNHSQPMSSLAPKELIERFQLDKSQLAFTFCTLGPDGHTYIPDWTTTVYSSVMTELSVNASVKRSATCPNCSHCFEIASIDIEDDNHGQAPKKLKKG